MTEPGPTHDQPDSLGSRLRTTPFFLGLSSGFFGFFAHCGLFAAFERNQLRPHGLGGSSAGALVAAAWAAGVEASQLQRALFSLSRAEFWDPRPGLGYLRGTLFRRKLEELLPVTSIESCVIPLRISTFDAVRLRTRVLATGPLAPAVQASCSVPGLFQPVWLDGRPHFDGGIADRPGLAGLAESPAPLAVHHQLPLRLSSWRRYFSSGRPSSADRPVVTFTAPALPSVGPFALARGRLAFERAYDATARLLARPAADFLQR